jgi:acetyltransferase-like isoleucine patch superfamily enzyme
MKAGVGTYCVSFRNDFGCNIEGGNFTSIARNFEVLVGPSAQHATAIWPNAVANSPMGDWGWDYFNPMPIKGNLSIGSDVWIGAGVTAVSARDLSIGHGAIVGTRSVVTRDVPPFAVVVGIPARIVRYRFEPQVIESLLRISWWNWHPMQVQQRAAELRDVRSFIAKYDLESVSNNQPSSVKAIPES